MATKDISEKQLQILKYIIDTNSLRGYPPSVREIGSAMNLSSTSTVHGHLDRLEKKGYLRRDPSKPRAIEIVKVPTVFFGANASQPPVFDDTPQMDVVSLPIIGRVACGAPILAEENVEDHFALPLSVLGGHSDDVFVLKAKGDSMINAGILDGDQLVVRMTKEARNGEIVIALIDDSATCKRYFREKDFIRLQPENDNMEPIFVRDASIVGKVIGVYRQIR